MSVKLKYFVIGFLFGAMFPIGAIIFEMIIQQEMNIVNLHMNNNLMFMIDSAPLFLGLFAFVGGQFQQKAINIQKELAVNADDLKSTLKIQEKQRTQLKENATKIDVTAIGLMNNLDDINGLFKSIESNAVVLDDDASKIYHHGEVIKEDAAAINLQTHNIHENASQVNIFSKQMLASVQHLSKTLIGMVDKVNTNVRRIEKMAGEVKGIDALKSNIEKVSDQIDLLALNASIEAARAGEAGRGFAVVANEIKKLSQESHTATDAIEKSIDQVKDSTTEVQDNIRGLEFDINKMLIDLESISEKMKEVENHQRDELDSVGEIVKATKIQEQNVDSLHQSLEDVEKQITDIRATITLSSQSLAYNSENIIMLNNIS